MYIICPLCHLRSHLNRFKPEELEDIIELIEMRSLGRARGWKETARYSALDNEELMGRIADRCLIILRLIGKEVTTPEDEDLEEELRDRIEELSGFVDEYEEEMDELLADVNRALPNVYEEFDTLEEALKALIVEYHEALEEEDDDEEEENDEDDDEEDDDNDEREPLSELDKELLIAEREGLIEKIDNLY